MASDAIAADDEAADPGLSLRVFCRLLDSSMSQRYQEIVLQVPNIHDIEIVLSDG
jgi:hypothetical protein